MNKKIVVVTGSKGLLGKSIVKKLSDNNIITVGLDILNKGYKKINKNHYELYVDISSELSIKETLKYISIKIGKISGWVNNAYPRTKDWGNKLEEVEIDSFNENLKNHLSGYFACSRLVLENMKKNKSGSVVNISSIYGFLAPDFKIYEGTKMTSPVAYSAIKGAIINLTKYFASYYGKYKIRVNTISPGGIFDSQNKIFVNRYIAKTFLKRMGSPDDIANAVYFLVSEDSTYITGHNLIVDGGYSVA